MSGDAYSVNVTYDANSNTITLNDFMVYGSSRLGSYVVNEPEGGTTAPAFTAANLRFELTDHLGTVRAVITGEKTGEGEAKIISLTDYYPYGMDMPGRTFSSELYRYGYQGSERDPEMSPKNRGRQGGAGYTTFFRALDPRIGRWLTPDPKVFPWQSPYVSMDGNPVALVDPWGASTDGGGKGGAQKHADNYKTETGRSYSTDPSDGYVFEGVDVVVVKPSVNTPTNRPFVPVSTMVFNDFTLQQEVMEFGRYSDSGSAGENGFDINGFTLIDINGIGNSSNNFGSDGTSDGVIDVSGISDVFGGHSQGLSKILGFWYSVWGGVQESGVLKEGGSGLHDVGNVKDDGYGITEISGILNQIKNSEDDGFRNWVRDFNRGKGSPEGIKWFKDPSDKGDTLIRIINTDTVVFLPNYSNGNVTRGIISMDELRDIWNEK